MGVPVVSLRGQTHVSRVTPGLLDRVGLGRFAAQTRDGYVDTAVRLAGDLEQLSDLRKSLRDRMHAGSLTDGVRLARQIESAYREMWTRWCQSGGN